MASLSDVEASIQNPVPFIENNIAVILNILEFAREVKPEVFIQISTDEVMGAISKNSSGHKEWDAIIPSNPYFLQNPPSFKTNTAVCKLCL